MCCKYIRIMFVTLAPRLYILACFPELELFYITVAVVIAPCTKKAVWLCAYEITSVCVHSSFSHVHGITMKLVTHNF